MIYFALVYLFIYFFTKTPRVVLYNIYTINTGTERFSLLTPLNCSNDNAMHLNLYFYNFFSILNTVS